MSTEKRKDRFIMQAGILATAGLISRVIGILYRSPLTGIIGDEGNGYYSAAYNIYTIILLISSYSIPSAISKVIAGKLAVKDYRNAQRVFQCALIYVIVVGAVSSSLAFVFADHLVQEGSAPVLRVLAPVIFLSGLLGVFRGYFQAHGTMVPTSISQIVEQMLHAVVSIGAAYFFVNLMEMESDTTRAIYGAAGSAIGIGAGVVIALLFMSGIYMLNCKGVRKRIRRDKAHQPESYKSIFLVIIGMVTPILLSTCIYNSCTPLNQTIYAKILSQVKGFSGAEIAKMYGIFAGKAVVIANIPIALASAMASAIMPSISSSHALGEMNAVRDKVAQGIRTTMMIAIPCAVGLAVLAKPVTQVLFPQRESLDQASALLAVLSVSVIFYGLSTLTNAVLQAVGKVNRPVVNAAVALLIQTVAFVAMLLYTDWNQYALVLSMVLYSFLTCVLNNISMRHVLKYRQEVMKTFVKPMMAALLMGLAAYGSYYGIYALLPVNVAALAVALPVSGIVYFAAAMALGAVDEADLMRLPKGYLLVAFGKKCYLLRDPEFEKPDMRRTTASEDGMEKRKTVRRKADGKDGIEKRSAWKSAGANDDGERKVMRKKKIRKKVVKKRKKPE